MNLFDEVARRATAAAAPPSSPVPKTDNDDYGNFCRPAVARRLAAIGLDKTFTWAAGDRMAYERDGARQEVLDMVGGAGSTLFGHNHPEIIACARTILEARVPHHAQVSNRAHAGLLARSLSAKLEEATGRSFIAAFSNSGTEAVEAAIAHAQMELFAAREALLLAREKDFALALHAHRDDSIRMPAETRRLLGEILGGSFTEEPRALQRLLQEHNAQAMSAQPLLLAVRRSFHGMTAGALSLTHNAEMREPFAAPRLRTCWIPAGDCAAATAAVEGESIAVYALTISASGELNVTRDVWCNVLACFAEPVQGEGGVFPLRRDFVEHLRRLADGHRFPLVFDEIQSGMGRCGTFTAAEQLGVRGDYYLFGKALGGGIGKIAVTMIDRERYEEKFGWIRGSTFAEDEFTSLISLQTLAIYDRDDIAGMCREKGRYFLERLLALKQRYPAVVEDVRGVGLMIGFELVPQNDSASPVLRVLADAKGLGAFASGYLLEDEHIRAMNTSSSPNTLRLEPSAYIRIEDIDATVAALERLCRTIECANAGRLVRHLVGGARTSDVSQFVEDWRDRQVAIDDEPRPGEARVAFLGYPVESWRLSDWDPSLSQLSRDAYEKLLEVWQGVVPPQVTQRMRITTPQGKSVHLTYIALLLSSRMFEQAMQEGRSDELREQIDDAVDLAIREGCSTIGFGGLTSVVTHNCRKAARSSIGLTTGNALTVGMGIEGIRSGAVLNGVDLSRARAAIVGAAGNIASVYARIIARDVCEMVLLGRKHTVQRVREVAERIYEDAVEDITGSASLNGIAAAIVQTKTVDRWRRQGPPAGTRAGSWLYDNLAAELGEHAPIQIGDDLRQLSRSRVIVSASNSSSPIIYPQHLADGPVLICDIAVPPDVSPEVLSERPDVVVLAGGAVRIRGNETLRTFASPLPDGHMYACMAEAVLLGLMERADHFSFGDIEPAQVEMIMKAAKEHGFECGIVRNH